MSCTSCGTQGSASAPVDTTANVISSEDSEIGKKIDPRFSTPEAGMGVARALKGIANGLGINVATESSEAPQKKKKLLDYSKQDGQENTISIEEYNVLDRLTNAGTAYDGEYSEGAIARLREHGLVSDFFHPKDGWKLALTKKGYDLLKPFFDDIKKEETTYVEVDDYSHVQDNEKIVTDSEGVVIAIEDIMPTKNREQSIGMKVLSKVAGLMLTVPEMSFDSRDYDIKVVEKMMKYPDLLKVVGNWIFAPDQAHVQNLFKAMKVFGPMQHGNNVKKLYRGFSINGNGQQALGLKVKGFFRKKPENFEVGQKMEYVTDKAVSFTEFESTAATFGNVTVSIDAQKYRNRLFWFGPNLAVAVTSIMYDGGEFKKRPHYPYYGEHLLLPSPQPIEFTIEAYGKDKAGNQTKPPAPQAQKPAAPQPAQKKPEEKQKESA